MNKEKTIPGPFHPSVYDENTGDSNNPWAGNLLTTGTYYLDPNAHLAEARLKDAAQTRSAGGRRISAPSYLEDVKTYRRARMGNAHCITCHTQLSLDLGACKRCVIPHDRLLDSARLDMHNATYVFACHHVDPVSNGEPLPTCDALFTQVS